MAKNSRMWDNGVLTIDGMLSILNVVTALGWLDYDKSATPWVMVRNMDGDMQYNSKYTLGTERQAPIAVVHLSVFRIPESDTRKAEWQARVGMSAPGTQAELEIVEERLMTVLCPILDYANGEMISMNAITLALGQFI